MNNLSSPTGFKAWAWLTDEQQRLALKKIERGLGECDTPGTCQTRPDFMDQWYTFFVHADGTMTVENRKKF